jgi:uncharacterized protein YgiM (DUF1202 family)
MATLRLPALRVLLGAAGVLCTVGAAQAQTAAPVAPAVQPTASTPMPAEVRELTPLPVANAGPGGSVERLQVVEAYAEMHRRPHRYFPVFSVVRRGQSITIESSQGDWVEVRTDNGERGWVLRQDLDASFTAAGIGKSRRDQLLDDYWHDRLTVGTGIGRLATETRFEFWSRVRLTENFSIEGSVSQALGQFAGSGMWQLDVIAEPWPAQAFSPYLGLGFGQLRDYADQRAIALPKTTASQLNLRAGVGYRLGEHYALRLEAGYYNPLRAERTIGSFSSFMASLSYSF